MKKYIILVILIFTATGCIKKKIDQQIQSNTVPKSIKKRTVKSQDVEGLVDIIYGKNGANLTLDQIFAIQELVTLILNLSDEQQQLVAAATAHLLQEQVHKKEQLQQLVDMYLIKYLQEFAQDADDLQNIESNILEIAQKIIDYIKIEQENIFSNQKSKHIFLTAIQHREKANPSIQNDNDELMEINQLPSLMNFWITPTGQQILNNYDPTDTAKIQFIAEMMIDMTVMLLAQEGASMANAHITAQGALLAAKISKDSQTIQTNMQAFQTKAQTEQQAKLQAMMTAFSDAQKDIQAKTQQASAVSNLELDYLYKNISVDKPQQNYIFNQIQFDQIFALGTMLTPQGALWKNPFSVGDWEYEKSSNSFWQYQSSPITNQTTDSSGKTTSSSLQAENNAIYAEYFTTASKYTIAGSISLNRADFPFFAGIIFNKARWISGDFEAIRKCRMIGVYGASTTDIGVYFAQQYTMNDTQIKANPNDDPIQTSLQQIINKKVSKKINLPSDAFANLQNAPITFNYEITNSPTTVAFKIWTGNNAPATTVIENLDPAIYMYHGIGFICPGAVAQFTLTQPQDFIFTTQAISNYKD